MKSQDVVDRDANLMKGRPVNDTAAKPCVEPTDFLARAITVIAVVFAVLYIMAFNLAPSSRSGISLALVGVILVSLVVSALLNWTHTFPVFSLVLYMSFASIAMDWIGYPQNLDALLRYCVSLAALLTFVRLPIGDMRQLISRAAVTILGYALLVAVILPPITVAGVRRASPFVGGSEGFHSSAIVVSAIMIIVWTSPWVRWHKVVAGSVCAVLLGAYGGATEMLMVAVFVIHSA